MEDLATLEDLRLFMDDPTIDPTRAALFLKIASGEVRGYCGQLFDPVEQEEILLDGKGSSVLLLPELPVTDVAEVLEISSGSTWTTLNGPDVESPVYEWNEDGILRRTDGGVFARRFRAYRVVYSHGYPATPDPVWTAVLRAAARGFDHPDGMRQETLGRYSYTVAGEAAGIGLYQADKDELAPYVIEGARGRAGSGAPAEVGS